MFDSVLRSFILSLSNNKNFEKFLVNSKITKKLVDRFVAGYDLNSALEILNKLNSLNIRVTLDYLGESVLDKKEAEKTFLEYMKILNNIKNENSISVKLTSIGLDIDEKLAYNYLKELVQNSNFIEIDMESSKYTQITIDLYKKLKSEFPNKKIAIAIQSYLKRSLNDVKELLNYNPIIRLVKGAYKEPKEIAYEKKSDVDKNYIEILKLLLEKSSYTLIATHDERIINFVKKMNVDKSKFEFQMLYGIKFDLLLQLKNEGYRTAIYLPYGTHWYPYFMRRLAERPANVGFLVRNLFSK
ncbi:MAG: proline dehydrogenase family protein [Candidatus Hydrothermia bacterium]|nr:proline dehydrogenase family protein [Candidatus Hydrothermia bacterium]